MNKGLMHKFLLLVIGLLSYRHTFAQKFNTDAVNKFWVLVDRVKMDKPLTDSLWNSYYNLYGNRNYIENNRDTAQALEHRKYLEWVFRPSMADSLVTVINKKNNPTNDILKNLLYVKAHENALRNYTPQITSPAYVKTCIALAKNYLPANVKTFPKGLTIYINAMTFDAAVQPPDMYFGLSVIYENDRFQKGTIAAHEFHHQLRVNKESTGKLTPADSASYSIIYQINNEGAADQVDKTLALKYRKTMYGAGELMHWLFDDAEKTISRLDSALLVNSKNDAHLSAHDFRVLTHYSSGHIPGFYMTNVIIRNGNQRELILHSDNPFHIFYLYNQSAKKDKANPPVFSDGTMAYLKQLEKRAYPE
jgi:hypothetical protein